MAPKWIYLFGAMLLMIGMAGCAYDSETDPKEPGSTPQAKSTRQAVKAWMASNPCGALSVRPPLVNVTGHVTAVSSANQQLFLYLAANHSLDSVLWAVDHCRYLARTEITDDGRFQFPGLPAGNYSVLYRRSPDEPMQGFPVIDEQNSFNHTVEMLWHGGDHRHSLGVFAIRARTG